MTPAALRLLEVLRRVAPAAGVVLLGDPDSATQTFRGGDPTLLAREWAVLGDGPTVGAAAQPPAARQRLLEVTGAVAGHIGVLGDGAAPAGRAGRRRRAGGGPPPEVGQPGGRLRRLAAAGGRTCSTGVPWADMAVVVRGQARSAALRRALQSAGVPVGAAEAELPVRDEPAVRPLLALLQVVVDLGLGRGRGRPRRRRARRPRVPARGGRPGRAAPAAACAPSRRARRRAGRARATSSWPRCCSARRCTTGSGSRAGPCQRVGRMILAGVGGLRAAADGTWAAGTSAEAILWAMWDASRLAAPWRETALAGGAAGARADRDLDAVLAILRAAATFGERLPGAVARGVPRARPRPGRPR